MSLYKYKYTVLLSSHGSNMPVKYARYSLPLYFIINIWMFIEPVHPTYYIVRHQLCIVKYNDNSLS